MTLQCHKCKEIIFEWEGTRAELLPNSRQHVYFHTGCYAQVKMERAGIQEDRRREVKTISE